jgi:hypothetical protein
MYRAVDLSSRSHSNICLCFLYSLKCYRAIFPIKNVGSGLDKSVVLIKTVGVIWVKTKGVVMCVRMGWVIGGDGRD